MSTQARFGWTHNQRIGKRVLSPLRQWLFCVKKSQKICLSTLHLRSRSEIQSLHMGLTFYSTPIDLGFCSWFSILVFAQKFCSRFFTMYFSRLGRMLRATAKVVGHGKSRRPRHCICVHGQKFSHFIWAFTSLPIIDLGFLFLVFDFGFCSWVLFSVFPMYVSQ